jgi:hypothetical protein
VRRCAESWRDGRFVLEQETNAYSLLARPDQDGSPACRGCDRPPSWPGADAWRDRLDTQLGDLSIVKAALDRTQAEARAARERAEALRREGDAARKARGLRARLRAAVRAV